MKKLLFLIGVVVGGAVALQLLPAERRTRLKERLREIEKEMPPVVMMSAMRRFEEQNDELLDLLREQNKLLRKQNDILQTAASAGESRG